MNALIKEALNGNARIGCFLSEVAAPNLLRLLKVGGMEMVIVDCEHGYFDYSQVAALCAVGNGIDLPIVVRVPSAQREGIQKVMDAGADGILLPMTGTAEMARTAVDYAKYTPVGKRGISTMRPHSNYQPGKLLDYMARANERTMVFAQIETCEGVANAPAIAALDGLDALIVGPNDLSQDMGFIGQLHAPQMLKAYEQVAQAARQAGKPCGIITSDMSLIHQCEAMGMKLFSCDSELGLLMKGVKGMRRSFDEKPLEA